jgi:hypothetical protein
MHAGFYNAVVWQRVFPLYFLQVFNHSLLSASDAVLQQLGITHGDQLVMLPSRPTIKRPRAQTTPVCQR